MNDQRDNYAGCLTDETINHYFFILNGNTDEKFFCNTSADFNEFVESIMSGKEYFLRR